MTKKLYRYPETSRRWYQKHKNDLKTKHIYTNSKLKNRYGISLEDYNTLFKLQASRCKICNRHQDELNRKLHVDHDHKTREVRGLLCRDCNNGLGHFKDEVLRLREAIKYLGVKMKVYDEIDLKNHGTIMYWVGIATGSATVFLLEALIGWFLLHR